MTLWKVVSTWANKGQTGTYETVVLASDAISALQKHWEEEDPSDLRTVSIEWLTPADCVVGAETVTPTPSGDE